MARRKKEEIVEEVIKETVATEEIEELAKKPEMVAEIKEIVKEEKKKTIVIIAPRVNVRKSPSLLGEVQKVAVAGERFNLVKDGDDGFYEVICEGQHAFVMKSYADLV